MRVRPWDPCLWSSSLRRSYSCSPSRSQRRPDGFNYNPSMFEDDNVNYRQLKRVTAGQLAKSKEYPKNVAMLVRDFIQDSLYNPHYGYFSKQAIILSSRKPLDYGAIHNSRELENYIIKTYGDYKPSAHGPGRQVWHTPTELFKPWYSQAIAQCILSEYMLKSYPYDDLVIYEVGAGNGTLANDLLGYVRDEYPPEVYERVHYNIIEISPQLAKIQREKLVPNYPGVQIFNKNIFDWDIQDNSSCFFIGLEVIDNFPHDEVRYSIETRQPYQGLVAIDEWGDFTSFYEPVTDDLIADFLKLREELGLSSPVMPPASPFLRRLRLSLPFAPNLSRPEYIPTQLLQFLYILREKFPRHKLLLSDFATLPDTIPGHNAPVVQTRLGDTMVPCQTLLVKQGYFDIFFPTSFNLLRDLYEHIMAKPYASFFQGYSASPGELGTNFFSHNRWPSGNFITSASGLPVGSQKSSVFTHKEFMETYAHVSNTQLKNGENPLLDYYQNVKFLF